MSFNTFILYGRLWTVKLNASVCRGHLDWWVIEILIQHNTQRGVINHGNKWNDEMMVHRASGLFFCLDDCNQHLQRDRWTENQIHSLLSVLSIATRTDA